MNINEFKEFVNTNLGDQYEVLSNEFKNTRSIIKMKHLLCNNEYTVIAYNILKDKPTKCPYCNGKKQKSFEEVQEQFKNFKNGEFEVIGGNYINNKSKLLFKHNKCNNTFECSAINILNGYKKCPYCNPYRKLTTDEFKLRVFEIVGNEYTVIGEYINNSTKIKIKHNKCNNTFEITPANFIKKKNKCIYCGKNNKRTTDVFKFEVKQMYGDEYTVLGEYINNSTKIKIKHNKCNNEYLVSPSNFLLGTKCPKCNIDKQKLTNDEFKSRVFELVGSEYSVIEDYKNYNTKIKMLHNKCNNTFEMSPTHFLNGQRCPNCRNYKGEEKIKKWLDKNNIEYKTQYSFKDLYYKSKNHPLKFDFKLDYDNGDILLIEFDGIQHFENWYYNDLKDQQNRDKLKNDYCKDHNYELLRITYKDFNNIENILEEYLKDFI
jgi:hypothetical protein